MSPNKMSLETQKENRMGTAKMFPLILSMSLPDAVFCYKIFQNIINQVFDKLEFICSYPQLSLQLLLSSLPIPAQNHSVMHF